MSKLKINIKHKSKQVLILIALFFLFAPLHSQICGYNNSIKGSDELCGFYRKLQFTTDKNADIALEKVLSVIGASKRFVLIPCDNINNCVATSYKGIRYIIYDKYFLDEISTTNDSWVKLSILAHEVGHHINGHALDLIIYNNGVVDPPSLSESRKMELEADEFSGFIMAKLGATLKQSQEAINLLCSNSDDTYSTHPSKTKRLKSIAKGYNSAKNNLAKYNPPTENYNYEYYIYQGLSEQINNNSTSAISNYSKAINIEPEIETAYKYRAQIYWFNNKLKKAYNDINKAIEINPEGDPSLYKLKGNIFNANQEDLKAIDSYKISLELDPMDDNVYSSIAENYLFLKQYRNSLTYINKAIQLNKNDAYYYKIRGKAYKGIQEYNNAKINFEKAITISPKKDEYYIELGSLYYDLNKYKSSVYYLKKAVELNNKESYTYYLLGNVYYDVNDFEASIYYLSKSNSIKASSGNYMIIGMCYGQQKKHITAIKYLNKAIEINSKNSEAYYNRALEKLYIGDRYGACKDLSLAGELGSTNAYKIIQRECQ